MPRPRKYLRVKLLKGLYLLDANGPITLDGYSRNTAFAQVYIIGPGGERLYRRRNGDVIARKNPGRPARENADRTPTTGQRKDPSAARQVVARQRRRIDVAFFGRVRWRSARRTRIVLRRERSLRR